MKWLGLALVAVALWPGSAKAYCLAGACADGSEPFCDQGTELFDDCEIIRWKTGCTGFVVQRDGGGGLLPPDLIDSYIAGAFDKWATADCGGGTHPGLVAIDMGTASCNKVEYNIDAGNQNTIIVRLKAWPHPHTAGHDIALTTTTFDPDTGELLDADMELNLANFSLTTSDEEIDFDLESVVTHEVGHFLGMGHSFDEAATMRPSYDQGSIELRDLSADDVSGICALYPPDDSVDASCNPLGRHGFSPDCKASQTEGTCSLTSGAGASLGASLVVTLGAALALRSRRARRGRSRSPRA